MVCFKPYQNFSSCTPDFFFSTSEFFFSVSPGFFLSLLYKSEKNPDDKLKKIQVYWKKIQVCRTWKFSKVWNNLTFQDLDAQKLRCSLNGWKICTVCPYDSATEKKKLKGGLSFNVARFFQKCQLVRGRHKFQCLV